MLVAASLHPILRPQLLSSAQTEHAAREAALVVTGSPLYLPLSVSMSFRTHPAFTVVAVASGPAAARNSIDVTALLVVTVRFHGLRSVMFPTLPLFSYFAVPM